MTPEQTAGAVRASVSEIGTAFSESPRTLRRARLLGLSGWAFHVAGRAGALGDVRAETVAAALGFIAPEAVADGWDGALRVAAPADVAAHNLAECCRWGVENLGDFPRVSRLVELAGRVVEAADPAGMPLFAAWRAMPVPDDSPGARAAVLLLLLREHRAGAHLLAVRASGMTPLEAIIAGPEGEGGALAYGWSPPFPPAEPLIRRSLWADAVADGITSGAYVVLGIAERVELVGLLESTVARLRAAPAGDLDDPVGGRAEPGSRHADRSP
ncbi:hypothetical protein [Polymorphospora sp. NPDC050346]|uniref:SCO6745 family protein n=1 Tax=Polymorphospora sp. NPDC050346 TaxID=3155780 RepID=UPI00340C67CE